MPISVQQKITKLFKRGAKEPVDDELNELEQQIEQLSQIHRDKQNELFELQRISYKHKCTPPNRRSEVFVRPEKIVLSNAVDSLKAELEQMSVLSGIEVESYELDDHCCIRYLMQHDTKHQIKHGLRIELQGGLNTVSKSTLPMGFNLNAVMADFDNIMVPDCLCAIRQGLVAYYDRLEQYDALKKLLSIEAQLFKLQDGSHVKISFVVKSLVDEDIEPFDLVIMLDYRVYDVRPKQFSINETDLPEGAAEVIRNQCALFKRKPLDKAFEEAFIDSVGPYTLVKQVGARPVPERTRKRRRPSPPQHQYRHDDTYQPEDCSHHSSDDADVD